MVKIGSYAYCIDNTGVILVKIFRGIGSSYKKEASIGEIVYVTVRAVNKSTHFLKDDRLKWKFRKGSVHKAVIVHVREKFRRYNRTFMWFPRNAVVIINKNKLPLTKRIKQGIPREVADEYPAMGSMCPKIL